VELSRQRDTRGKKAGVQSKEYIEAVKKIQTLESESDSEWSPALEPDEKLADAEKDERFGIL